MAYGPPLNLISLTAQKICPAPLIICLLLHAPADSLNAPLGAVAHHPRYAWSTATRRLPTRLLYIVVHSRISRPTCLASECDMEALLGCAIYEHVLFQLIPHVATNVPRLTCHMMVMLRDLKGLRLAPLLERADAFHARIGFTNSLQTHTETCTQYNVGDVAYISTPRGPRTSKVRDDRGPVWSLDAQL